MKAIIFLSIFLFEILSGYSQINKIVIINGATKAPIAGATIAEGKIILGMSDSPGSLIIKANQGVHALKISITGFESVTESITFPLTAPYTIALNVKTTLIEEVTIISSTRNNQRIENSPLKVEVLGREEMDEENSIKPSNIGSILGDMSGVQIQQTSQVSNNSNVRIQGLEGRYTQILKDGMPLFDGFSGSFGVLSIPPLDLKQIELIKGSASTLYGGGAIGGLVNIISRKPNDKQEASFTGNISTLKETSLNTYFSKKYKKAGYTFFAGYTNQPEVDVNKDGLSDVSKSSLFIAHPQLYLYPSNKASIKIGYTLTIENKNGGDMNVIKNEPDSIHQFFEKNESNRHTGELIYEQSLSGKTKLEFKNSISGFNRALTTNTFSLTGKQLNRFSELSIIKPFKKGSWVAGINSTGENFKKISSSSAIEIPDYTYSTWGFFVQHTWNASKNTVFEEGLREDLHNQFGSFFLPRFSVFHRFNEQWASRAGIGLGYKVPNILSGQITDPSINDLLPFPYDIKAERSIGYNAEVNFKKKWNGENTLFINHAFFVTQINDPIVNTTDATTGKISSTNGSKPIITKGFDTYIKATIDAWEIYLGYTFTIAERKYLNNNQFMPLTPKNRFASTIVKEWEELGFKAGIEASYTGSQIRIDGTNTPGYLFLAAMIDKKINKNIRLVLNCENLLDYRQSKVESLYTGSITNPEFKPTWAPTDGRIVNLSLNIKL